MKNQGMVFFLAGTLLLAASVFFNNPATADLWERHISGAYEVPQFDGSGEKVAIYDTGCAWNHIDFGDSGQGSPNFDGQIIAYLYDPDTPDDSDGHGTALAGIIAGTGVGDGSSGSTPSTNDACGIARGAKLIILEDWHYSDAIATDIVHNAVPDAWNLGARLFVSGYPSFNDANDPGAYFQWCRDIDDLIHSPNGYDMTVFVPAGNDGTGTGTFGNPGHLTMEASAKNVITVGGFNDAGTIVVADDSRAIGSSIGPTKDNRVKPDLLGQFLYKKTTDVPGSGGYSAGDYVYGYGGTSASTGYVAGIAVIVRQMYKSNYFDCNPSVISEDDVPHAATLKALLIADAIQLSMPTNTRFEQGWGEPSLKNIYDIGPHHLIIDETSELAQGESATFTVKADTVNDLKITLVWTDRPGWTLANPALVDNLDLEVRQGGIVWYGNMGLHTSLFSTAGPGINVWDTTVDSETNSDDLNNVENVFIPKAQANGLYEITVRASRIPGGGKQKFALVASGVSPGVGLPYWPQKDNLGVISLTQDVIIAVHDSNLNDAVGEPFDSVIEVIPPSRVRVFSDTDTSGINISLVETAADSRTYTNTISLTKTGYSNPVSGILRVSEGDTLTIEYSDEAPISQKLYGRAVFYSQLPVAIDDFYTMDEDSSLTVERPGVLTNDYGGLSATLVTPPNHGNLLSFSAWGGFYYEPYPNYYGTDSFTYRASDGANVSNAARVTITINPTPDVPAETCQIELYAGWNMISLPILPEDNRPEVVLQELAGRVCLYAYYPAEPDPLQRWRIFDRQALPIDNTLISMELNKAFWLWVDQAQVLSISGFSVYTNQMILAPGWNFIGFQDTNLPVEDALVSWEIADAVSYMYYFDASNPNPLQQWKIWDKSAPPEANTLQTIEPTRGYWVYAAPVQPGATPPLRPAVFWSSNGNSKLDGQAVPVGTKIAAYDPQGIFCGGTTVTVQGRFTLICAGDDPNTPEDEGAVAGDTITFYMDGFLATVTGGSAVWQSASQEVNLEATSEGQPNRAPVAAGQSITTDEDTAVAIVLSATDEDGDALTYSVVAPPAHGSLSGAEPNLTYTPAAGYHGADSFTFKANDGQEDSNIATVSITVNAVNHAPVAASQSVATTENTPLGITLVASDPDGDPLTYTIVNAPVHGVLSGTAPNLTYTPTANYSGPDGFDFRASDGKAESNVATISITVNKAQYVFSGFFSPVDNLPIVNNAKAGQAIPIKWRITDQNGIPISDPASFKSITSYPIGCGTLTGAPTDQVEEYAAGSSGLQYLGDGYWQFNWKTPNGYAGTCRILVVSLGDQSTHNAAISFK